MMIVCKLSNRYSEIFVDFLDGKKSHISAPIFGVVVRFSGFDRRADGQLPIRILAVHF